ncbi:MAG: FemAB family XrtA/PEP-CTERM system-associated protein [bacterium]
MAGPKVTIYSLEDRDRERWDEYVHSCPISSLYHLSAWKKVLEPVLGHPAYYLYAEDEEGEVVGVLPMAHLKSWLFGSRLISLPCFNYGGVCAHDSGVQMMLLQRGTEIACRVGARHLELRQMETYSWDLPVKQHRVAMTLDLPGSWAELWQGFSAKLRNQIRKGEHQGFNFRQGGEEELESFYQVFAHNMRDLGTPVLGKNFFQAVLATFPDRSKICTVYRGSQPLASGLILGFRDTLQIPWASSLREYNHLCTNMLLYWGVLRYACEAGYTSFDFGRSAPGSGTYRFKQQWGAKPHPLYWYYWLREGEDLPALHPENPKYRLAIQLWKRMPLPLTRTIGPLLARGMP